MAFSAGTVFVDVKPNLDKFAHGLSAKVKSALAPTAKIAAASLTGAGVAALAGLGAVIKVGLGEFSNYQKGLSQTQAVIKSTGGAAGVTADHVEEMASSLQGLTGQTDDAIVSTQDLLLTFTGIANKVGDGNDIFDQATKTVLDMSQALGQDTKSSAIQLGKALNDPIKGVTALQRVGVSFTASQKEQIKTLVKTGHTLEAQKLILGELNKEFGGSAEAFGKTLPGQIQILKRSFEDLSQSVLAGALPSLTGIVSIVKDVLPKVFSALAPVIQGVLGAIGPLLASLVPIIGDVARALGPVLTQVIAALAPVLRAITPTLGKLAQSLAAILIALLPLVPPLSDLLVALLPLLPALVDLTALIVKLAVVALVPLIGALASVVSFATKNQVVVKALAAIILIALIPAFVAWVTGAKAAAAATTEVNTAASASPGIFKRFLASQSAFAQFTKGFAVGSIAIVGALQVIKSQEGPVNDALEKISKGLATAADVNGINSVLLNKGLKKSAEALKDFANSTEGLKFIGDDARASAVRFLSLASQTTNAADKALYLSNAWKVLREGFDKGKDAAVDAGTAIVTSSGKIITSADEIANSFAGMAGDDLKNWRDGTVDAINGVDDLLGDLASQSHLTAKQVLKSFEQQVKAQVNYRKNFESLVSKNLPDDLLKQIQEMGIKGAGLVAALAHGNKKEIDRIIADWKRSQAESKRTADAFEAIPTVLNIIRGIKKVTPEVVTELSGLVNSKKVSFDQIKTQILNMKNLSPKIRKDLIAKLQAELKASVKVHASGEAHFVSPDGSRGTLKFYHEGGLVKSLRALAGNVPLVAQTGEYIMQRSAVKALGVPFLDALNWNANRDSLAQLRNLSTQIAAQPNIQVPAMPALSGGGSDTWNIVVNNPKPESLALTLPAARRRAELLRARG